MIKKITYDEIVSIWSKYMPNMSLEETSAMSCFKKMVIDPETEKFEQVDHYDLKNMDSTPTFWGAFDNDKLIGCNSGHMTMDRLYRSRGLYVREEYRGQRIGQKLLLKTISQAYHEDAIAIWSYPTMSAWLTYHHAGFELEGKTFQFDWELLKHFSESHSRCLRTFDEAELYKLETPQSP